MLHKQKKSWLSIPSVQQIKKMLRSHHCPLFVHSGSYFITDKSQARKKHDAVKGTESLPEGHGSVACLRFCSQHYFDNNLWKRLLEWGMTMSSIGPVLKQDLGSNQQHDQSCDGAQHSVHVPYLGVRVVHEVAHYDGHRTKSAD